MSELNEKYPDLIKDYSFNKVIYWKLEQSHNQPIERDKKLFASILPILKQTWEKVKYYREHLDELPKLKQIVEKRKKYIRTDTEFKIDNDLIKNNVLFLDDFKQTKTKKEVVSKNVKKEVECDFIDDESQKIKKKLNKSKTSNKKEESDKEDDGEYKKLPKINFLNKTSFKKDDSECDFID
jgi:hypothetical protein